MSAPTANLGFVNEFRLIGPRQHLVHVNDGVLKAVDSVIARVLMAHRSTKRVEGSISNAIIVAFVAAVVGGGGGGGGGVSSPCHKANDSPQQVHVLTRRRW